MKRSLLAGLFVVVLLASAAFAQSVTVTSPAAGATIGAAVQVMATANGGSYPASAMRVYVDNQSMYTVQAASLNTTLTLSAGPHFLVVVGWNTQGASFSQSMTFTVASGATANIRTANPGGVASTAAGAGVVVSSPASGPSGSPVTFAASAIAPAGRQIVAMRIYVDSASVFLGNTASLNTSVPMSPGTHNAVVQAWDNTGAFYKSNSITLNVGGAPSSGGTSAGSPSSTINGSGEYANNLKATSNWLGTLSQPDGALLYGPVLPTVINGYYANIAAIGMTKDPARYQQVQNWMMWYVNHLNFGDKWGLSGTIYDYNIDLNGNETSTGDADSTDSYAATFLSLAWNYYKTGDASAQAYVKSIDYQLDLIGGVIAQTQQGDGLTWAKPDYQIKYLMDNCEAYRGLSDLASLYQAIGETDKASYYGALASQMLNGLNSMWLNGVWGVYKDGIDRVIAPNMGTWYADATAQLFPVLEQVASPSDPRSQQAYAAFNAAWPDWANLSFMSQDQFPWVLVGSAATLMGDDGRTATYMGHMETNYVSQNFPWTFYSAEAGWFMRMNYLKMGGAF